MKNIKILSIFFLAIFIGFTSCEESEDSLDVDYNIAAEGVITTLKGTTGKLLGNATNPADLANSEVVLTDANADLTLNLAIEPGNVPLNVEKYQIVKSYNGGAEVVVAETTTLPYATSYESVSDYFDGLNVAANSVRIGDQIKFRVKVFTTTGNTYYVGTNASQYTVTVNCASDLAGAYSLNITTSNGLNITFSNEVISEVSPGYYKTTTTYRWAAGSIASDQGFNFNDVCGTLTVPQQGLAQGFYSNQVYGFEDGSANPSTEELVIKYITEFDGGANKIECIGVYTKL